MNRSTWSRLYYTLMLFTALVMVALQMVKP